MRAVTYSVHELQEAEVTSLLEDLGDVVQLSLRSAVSVIRAIAMVRPETLEMTSEQATEKWVVEAYMDRPCILRTNSRAIVPELRQNISAVATPLQIRQLTWVKRNWPPGALKQHKSACTVVL